MIAVTNINTEYFICNFIETQVKAKSSGPSIGVAQV